MSFGFDAIKEPYLDDLIREHIIFIDLSSLMNENFQKFSYKLEPLLIKNKKKLIILKSILNRLSKEALDFSKKYPNIPNTSDNALKIINILHGKNLIEFKAESSKVIGKYDFISKFHDLRDKHKLLLITEDYDLAKETLNLNNLTTTVGYKIIVKEINKLGYLEDIDLIHLEVPEREKFKLKTKINNIKSKKLNVTSIPSEGKLIICNGKAIKLLKPLGSGGEGTVYTTENELVCKIYKKEKLESEKLEKLKLMLTKKISCEGICWPTDLVYNVHKEFVGYLMPKAEGTQLQKAILNPCNIFSIFPNWKKRDSVNLCITILKKIQFLHDRNIILGDINPFNILVLNPKKVYLVDVDSYQVEDFPCPVGNSNYTAPEIQKKTCSDFLRTFENEYFAISTLLFMIMLLGKHPYSRKGGGTPEENIREMRFAYPLDGASFENVPNGNWRYIWSHMPYFIQEAFYTTFKKGYKNNLDKNRFTTKEWREKMEEYLDLLVSGKLETKDSLVNEVFPDK